MAIQHATTAQLLTLGLSHNEIRSQLAHGTLERIRRGAYTTQSPPDPEIRHRLLMRATVPTVDEGNVFSHISAGVLHRLPVPRDALGRATMIRTTSGHGDKGPHLVVRKTALEADEIEDRDGFRITTAPRTVFDLTRSSPFEWGLIMADAALHLGADRAAITEVIHRHPRLKGASRAAGVCAIASPRPESPLESVSRVRMMEAGLPTPELQFEIVDADGEFVARTDFAWPDFGVVGEVDGRTKYGPLLRPGQDVTDVVMAEKRREEWMRDLGFWVVRWGAAEAWSGDFVPRLRRALSRPA